MRNIPPTKCSLTAHPRNFYVNKGTQVHSLPVHKLKVLAQCSSPAHTIFFQTLLYNLLAKCSPSSQSAKS
ncbi:hypothetical protein MdSGHV005 [Musca domestica salivary gland hypertrophy virus]|uniref:Uncharacterized protein n=1 Tax=Musca hytrovirus(isolate Musca domestica/United States/Boucias/-) TaxID=523909 RepID=B2YFY2_MHVB|nr:hypothetical protein MdSGHV005 [Musca domestica salivary gland hypertrophy virus]ACD03464.1 hypothetical protein MdSGHV005 [Musca domestica salivary gland hypertrophy virus]